MPWTLEAVEVRETENGLWERRNHEDEWIPCPPPTDIYPFKPRAQRVTCSAPQPAKPFGALLE